MMPTSFIPPAPGTQFKNCPVAGCRAQIKAQLVMCNSHWNVVPSPMKKAILLASREPGSPAHQAAIAAACEAVKPKVFDPQNAFPQGRY